MTKNRVASALRTLLLLLAYIPGQAKCVSNTITVAGEIAKNGNAPININATVETPKGNVTEEVTTAEPVFEITVRFSTLTSYSMFWGHLCTNFATAVVVRARAGEKQLPELKVKLKDNVVLVAPGQYRLRKKVVIDSSGIRLATSTALSRRARVFRAASRIARKDARSQRSRATSSSCRLTEACRDEAPSRADVRSWVNAANPLSP